MQRRDDAFGDKIDGYWLRKVVQAQEGCEISIATVQMTPWTALGWLSELHRFVAGWDSSLASAVPQLINQKMGIQFPNYSP